ncbi:MAG: hypothetical protein H7Y04_06560 [Verrucomicrobia bacterium]|nr:hypothetical protein [Cytophagales bacterium]
MLPIGGVAMFLLSLYRLTAIALRFKSPLYYGDLFVFLKKKISNFLFHEYRLTGIMLLALVSYAWLNFLKPDLQWYLPVISGIVTGMAVLGLSSWLKEDIQTSLPEKSKRNLLLNLLTQGKGISNFLGVLGLLAATLVLLTKYSVQNISDLVFLLSGFALGGGGMSIFVLLTDEEAFSKISTRQTWVSQTQADTLLVTVLGGVFISHAEKNSILLPVLVAFVGICCSLLVNWLGRSYYFFSLFKTINALLMSLLVMIWVLWAKVPADIFCCLLLGIWGNWISAKIAGTCAWICKRLPKFWLRISVRGFTTFFLVFLTGSALLLIFKNTNLYGILLVCIGAFSQFNSTTPNDMAQAGK